MHKAAKIEKTDPKQKTYFSKKVVRMMKDTFSLENAYDRYGNVAYVDAWFKAECFIPGMRAVDEPGRTVKFRNKPDWYLPAVQLPCRRWERLNMSESLAYSLITKNGRYPKLYPLTALDLEKIARRAPKNDWRVEIITAFESLTYQRQGKKKWLLIEVNKGFA